MSKVAIIFGISGEQGLTVARGILNDGSYQVIYGVTHSIAKHLHHIKRQLDVHVVLPPHMNNSTTTTNTNNNRCLLLQEADLSNATSLKAIFETVQGQSIDIFLVTTTDLPPPDSADASLHDSEEREYQTIKQFFDTLKQVHEQQPKEGKVERHVVFSTLENVRGLVKWLELHHNNEKLAHLKPLDDGGIVPHYTSKGRGGEYALSLIHGAPSPWKTDTKSLQSTVAYPSIVPGLNVTLITLPFLYSNFTASAVPLPDVCPASGQPTQWSISAHLGDSTHRIDMLSVSDLQYIVPALFRTKEYSGQNIHLSSEKITMDYVARQFADLFGKDVIYAPLTVEEMNVMDIEGAECFAQMCQYLASPWGNRGDVELTRDIMGKVGREPQTFSDWLLTHSDEEAFEQVGLTVDAKPIHCVAVFMVNAICMQETSVIKGLLADKRKEYNVRACICNDSQQEYEQVEELLKLDPNRISIHYTNQNDVHSCTEALTDVDGVFVVSHLYNPYVSNLAVNHPGKEEEEEKREKIVIDACAASGTVRHIVFSTLESIEDIGNELQDTDEWVVLDSDDINNDRKLFDRKTRLAAYARSKGLSVTYVLMPVYSEDFFHALVTKMCNGDVISEEIYSSDDEDGGKRVICMSVDELGRAVANIMDSYAVYAGHEIALMTDVLSLKEASGIIKEVFYEKTFTIVSVSDGVLEQNATVIDTSSWTPSTQEEPDVEYKRLDTFAKDLGSMFSFVNKSQAVKLRQSVARTMELVPDVRTFRQWLEDNRDNEEFRAILGIR